MTGDTTTAVRIVCSSCGERYESPERVADILRNGTQIQQERDLLRSENAALREEVAQLRQRLALTGLRCQVCGQPADRNADGVLWLIDANPNDPSLRRGEERTTHPPVCRPCAHRSVRACPHLRTACVALRVRRVRLHGVSGLLYVPDHPAPAPLDADVSVFPFGDPRLPWVMASQLVVTLRDFEAVDLKTLATEEEAPI